MIFPSLAVALDPGALVAVRDGATLTAVAAGVEIRPTVGLGAWQGVVQRDDGETLLISPRHREWCLPVPDVLPAVPVTLRVRRADLAPVLTRPVRAPLPDGGAWRFHAGIPVVVGADGVGLPLPDQRGLWWVGDPTLAGPGVGPGAEAVVGGFAHDDVAPPHVTCSWYEEPPRPPVRDRIGGVVDGPAIPQGVPWRWGWPVGASFRWPDGTPVTLGRAVAAPDAGARCLTVRLADATLGPICTDAPPVPGGVRIYTATPRADLEPIAAAWSACLGDEPVLPRRLALDASYTRLQIRGVSPKVARCMARAIAPLGEAVAAELAGYRVTVDSP